MAFLILKHSAPGGTMKINNSFTHFMLACMGCFLPLLAQAENHALVHCNIFNGYENRIQANMTVRVRERLSRGRSRRHA